MRKNYTEIAESEQKKLFIDKSSKHTNSIPLLVECACNTKMPLDAVYDLFCDVLFAVDSNFILLFAVWCFPLKLSTHKC